MDEQALRRMLEGGGGIHGRLLRAAAFLPGLLYGGAMRARRRLYDAGVPKSFAPPLPTVSVGNIVMGGAGKTPFTAMLARAFIDWGARPAILLRGYRANASGESDEALLYGRLAPGAIVVADSDRARGAARAARDGATALLLDDGFQHLRLKRDVDIVLIDALCPWGGGRTIPAGTLREPKAALGRADAIVITRSDQRPVREVDGLRREIASRFPRIPVYIAMHRAAGLRRLSGGTVPLEWLSGRRVRLMSGIARPEAFAATVAGLGAEIGVKVELPDHASFSPARVREALVAAEAAGAPVIVTEKDAARPELREYAGERDVFALGVEMAVTDGDALLDMIRDRLGIGCGRGMSGILLQ
ncbi:MAG: tetraacyldisaccharide 4'-kinase [Planctomycetota bacterium]|jgi:tetraacyldisaccharide 4'-kinase|nr:tetraacyldisaccharide 4'-kinase [Planctomycetota bacterium]